MQHSNPGGASEGSSRDADLSPAVKIEIVPEGSNNLDLSPSFDWDSILNPRRGRAFNILRRLAKRIFRASWNRLFRRQYGTNFGMDPDFITERHHNAYGIPWAVGREQFDYLVSRGLESRHRLADLGCGTLRTGIWIIRYLDPWIPSATSGLTGTERASKRQPSTRSHFTAWRQSGRGCSTMLGFR